MGLGMDLDFDKYCVLDGSPVTVLPSPRHSSKAERKSSKGKPKCGNDLLSKNKSFMDINFNRYRSASCKTVPHRMEGNEVLRRCSVYQNSQDSRNTKKMRDDCGRRKIEFPRDDGGRRKIEFPRSSATATALTFGIIDSLCSSDEDNSQVEHNKSALKSLNRESVKSHRTPQNSQMLLDRSCQPISERGVSLEANQSAENVERQLFEDSKGRCDPVVRPLKASNTPREIGPGFSLHKSLSAKLALPHSPSHSESDCSNSSSPKSRFSPIQKMFDPFTRSKLQRSSLSSVSQSVEVAPVEKGCVTRKRASRKSLIHDFSNISLDVLCDSQFVEKEYNKPVRPCSPAHLSGIMKLVNKHGVPSYKFLVQNPEESFMAKACKMGTSKDWVYTFHTCNKRKNHTSGRGSKETNISSMVGQMQVSCSSFAEHEAVNASDDSIVTEFVLYDVAQARKHVADKNCSLSSSNVAKASMVRNVILPEETCKLDVNSDQIKTKLRQRHLSEGNILTPTELHPNLETAAIVIEVPFEKRESLKGKIGDAKSDQPLPNLNGLPRIEQGTNRFTPAKVNVVTSSGSHSLPTEESPGPSRLLDRWKLGGCCDCGGWDMGCPLLVFGNSDTQCAEDDPVVCNRQPWRLYAQGRKEKEPALRMSETEKGVYEVDFHAQLTTLQAFSVCVAILHCTEASVAGVQDRSKTLLQCDQLRFFMDEDVKYLIDSITEEEKGKADPQTKAPQSFVLNPPFSPIARV